MCEYVNVLAIDVGYRNFAWCCVDSENWQSPTQWQLQDLWKFKVGRRNTPTRDDLVEMMVKWYERNKTMIDTVDYVVLENQMRTPFIVMNVVLQTLMYGKVTIVHPMTVGAFWKLPVTRAEKKAKGVKICEQFTGKKLKGEKVDDLADSWLMAVWLLHKHKGVELSNGA